jgi:hypothetical protein
MATLEGLYGWAYYELMLVHTAGSREPIKPLGLKATLRSCIKELLVSNLGQNTVIFHSPFRQMPGKYLDYATTDSFRISCH